MHFLTDCCCRCSHLINGQMYIVLFFKPVKTLSVYSMKQLKSECNKFK